MNTKREPLLSARLFDVLQSLDGNVAEWVTDDLLGIHDDLAKHEAARAKDAELIQMLVDDVVAWMQPNLDERFRGEQWHQSKRILDAAAAAGFKPSEQ